MTKKLDNIICECLYDIAQSEYQKYEILNDANVNISIKLDKRVYKKIDKNIKTTENIRITHSKLLVAIAVAIITSILLVLGGIALGTFLNNSDIEWHDKYFSSSFDNNTINQNKYPQTIEKLYKPHNLPYGITEKVIINDQSSYASSFYMDDILYFSYLQTLYDGHNIMVNSENVVLSIEDVHGTECILSVSNKDESVFLIWNNGEYVFELYGTLPANDLLNIARSVDVHIPQ